jgi:hypothetical protein
LIELLGSAEMLKVYGMRRAEETPEIEARVARVAGTKTRVRASLKLASKSHSRKRRIR